MRSSRTPTASTPPPTAACGCAWRGRRSELHYGSAAQPLGREARDQLLAWLGFTELEYAPPGARERPRGRLRRHRAAPERAADSGQQLGPLAGRPARRRLRGAVARPFGIVVRAAGPVADGRVGPRPGPPPEHSAAAGGQQPPDDADGPRRGGRGRPRPRRRGSAPRLPHRVRVPLAESLMVASFRLAARVPPMASLSRGRRRGLSRAAPVLT